MGPGLAILPVYPAQVLNYALRLAADGDGTQAVLRTPDAYLGHLLDQTGIVDFIVVIQDLLQGWV